MASKEHRKELLDYIDENVGTSIALYGTMLRWTGDDEVARLDRLVMAFAEEHPNLPITKIMQDKVERYKRVALGAKAPPLSAPTPQGDILSLKDIDAKYILIDFWASWCGPCISQVPDLQKAHRDFNAMGFEILSVSLDAKADKWKAAISKHKLDWLHISDLRVWKSELAQSYNVTFVPFNLLVDQNGIIVAKNIHSKTLHIKLSELLTEK
jgi:peroxiredoxin